VQLSENDCKSSRLEAKDQYFLQLQEILARGLRGQLEELQVLDLHTLGLVFLLLNLGRGPLT
jgi:sulfur transfer complex TusBCD TusB component (DsrH family)